MKRRDNGKTRQTVDRFKVLNAFVDCTLCELSRAESAVWLILYRDTKPDGIATASQTNIGKRAGMSDRTVRRVIGSLRERGLLVVVRRGGLGRGTTAYRVLPMSKSRFDAIAGGVK